MFDPGIAIQEHVNWKVETGRNELKVKLDSLFSLWKLCEKPKIKSP